MCAVAFVPAPADAQTPFPPSSTRDAPSPGGTRDNPAPSNTRDSISGIQNPLGSGVNSICKLVKVLLNVIILLGVPIATFFVVFAGFKLIIARGNPGELERARENLKWVVVGIAIFLGAWLLAQLISNTIAALGITILGSCQ